MKESKTADIPSPEIAVYKHFMRLDREHRRRVAVRILRNQKMLADLYDHLLIQRSLTESGKDLAWESYSRSIGSER